MKISNMHHLDFFQHRLAQLKQQGNFRQFKSNIQHKQYIELHGQRLLNLSSNDYLGLASNPTLHEEFFDQTTVTQQRMSSSSSRLLTGNFPEYEQLELLLSQLFQGRSALLFNSGYHMNIGILPALADSKTLILADKLIHASMIDGIRLSSAKYLRYHHNDLQHLEQLLIRYSNDDHFERIIVVTESIFSMDGDETDLTALVQLKQQYGKVMLYVDEAHAIGVRGERGLGCAEEYNVIAEIDFLVGTFGKALASVGGYIICHAVIRDYLINYMRPLIFSTAQPPICMAWTAFMLKKVVMMKNERLALQQTSQFLQKSIVQKGFDCPSTSQIVPVIIGESQAAVDKAHQLQHAGFYIMPVRPPTVPQNSSRLRICLMARITKADLQPLLDIVR